MYDRPNLSQLEHAVFAGGGARRAEREQVEDAALPPEARVAPQT